MVLIKSHFWHLQGMLHQPKYSVTLKIKQLSTESGPKICMTQTDKTLPNLLLIFFLL